MIIDQLIEAIIQKKSPIVVGLDPRFNQIPQAIKEKCLAEYGETLEAVAAAIKIFNRGIIDAVADEVPAVKPQVAFYEQYGLPGMAAYLDACQYAASKGLVVIADVKRGDIGSTSKAYAKAHLGQVQVGNKNYQGFPADFATINPYLGDDCMKEFEAEIVQEDKGIFILVKTSNPTSGQLQDLVMADGKHLYEKTAEIVAGWNDKICGKFGYSPVGAVVGATYPEELSALRAQMPKAMLLVPGYGAQGGGAKDVINAFDTKGLGAIVNNSRGIIFAYEKIGGDYQEAARKAVIAMKQDINDTLSSVGKQYW
ncbi:orotidine-5'-phosphate decarboxylase [Fusibacter paucivorans]|uniref:orotidine-5'-phosphate decarboxylase n=1 Tax=Fusibacter paucivorans TaxID=76009 RepID=UPI001FE59A16|nr:orotidine-5'-phosphate decarboxylase [Fusibacter paucivorans]